MKSEIPASLISISPARTTNIPMTVPVSGICLYSRNAMVAINTKFVESIALIMAGPSPDTPISRNMLNNTSCPESIMLCFNCFASSRKSSPKKNASDIIRPIRFVMHRNAKLGIESGTHIRKTYWTDAKNVMNNSDIFASSLFMVRHSPSRYIS